MNADEREILTMALVGFRAQIADIQYKIDNITERLLDPGPIPHVPKLVRKREVSAEGRAKMAAAQRKRWIAKKRSAA